MRWILCLQLVGLASGMACGGEAPSLIEDASSIRNGTETDRNTTSPPIVGVPALPWWASHHD